MTKKDQHLSVYFPPITLYLDDVKAIEITLKENCKTYSLQTPNEKYFPTKELKENNDGKIFDLKISSREPHISVELSRNKAIIFSFSDDEISSGTVAKLKTIIQRRISELNTFSTIWFWPILAVIIILSIPYIFPEGEYLLWQGILGVLTIVVLICGMLLNHKYHSTIYLVEKRKKKPLFY